MSIQVATMAHDLERIALVINTAYKKVNYLSPDTERTSAQEIAQLIMHPRKKLYLSISPTQEVCGTLLLEFLDRDQAEISLFAIHPAHQGKHLGTALIDAVEKAAFQTVQSVILKVIPLFQENLIRFYERLGYHTTGKILDFPEEEKFKYIRPECRDRVFFSIMEKRRP